MIYTTYFANIKNLPDTVVPVSICGKAPDWYNGLQYKKLAPKREFFKIWKQTGDNDYYIQQFNKLVLKNLDAKLVVNELYQMANSQTIVLVCYESPEDFCHRHLVSLWLRQNGIECKEFKQVYTKKFI